MILSFKSTYEGMVHNSILFVETIKKKFLMIIIFFVQESWKWKLPSMLAQHQV